MNGGLTAMVALRDPGAGKTRLAPTLSTQQRAQLARAMARDVVTALAAAGVQDTVVVADGAGAALFADSLGLPVLLDRRPAGGLNAALTDALRTLGPHRSALLVCADLPGLSGQDVTRLATVDADVVVAPTRDGGTGGLLLRAGARVELAYGRRSCAAHRERARRAGLRSAEIVLDGFHHDVDELHELHEATARWPDSHTALAVEGWAPLPV